ncbi:Uncharacterized transporter YdeD [[Clostridium] ultunense Esp]|nr:Uncharacterized transporter YdeD [[Clostridium] ultunense Esp]
MDMGEKKRSSSYVRTIGVVMVITAAIFWGLSGTFAQPLFQGMGFTPSWLVTVRMLAAGVLLLIFASLQNSNTLFDVWMVRGDRNRLLLYGLFGTLSVQYTYFAAIHAGNAAVATLLQYLAPALITLYLAVRFRQKVGGKIGLALLMALTGTYFLVSNGSWDKLEVTPEALFWGILSAVALAFNTLFPIRLLASYGSAITVGWGMVIGGSFMSLFTAPWKIEGVTWSWSSLFYIFFIIFFGTFLAFFLFMESLKYISPTEASLLSVLEPLTSVAASVLWLHVPYTAYSLLGTILILGMVILLSLPTGTGSKNISSGETEEEDSI